MASVCMHVCVCMCVCVCSANPAVWGNTELCVCSRKINSVCVCIQRADLVGVFVLLRGSCDRALL